MAVNILLRRGTAAEWTASNPTLLEGEVGVETDTKKLKVGDGLTLWASLPYINLTPAAAASIYATSANPTFTGTVNGITKSMVGLGNVDNTSDANKPVSTAQQTALDLKAPLANPTFTGTVALNTGVTLVFEGATANDFETTLAAADPTADRTLTLPDVTGTLATQDYVTNEIGTHSADTTSVHGIADTAALATMTYADTAVSTHSADTTSVHGIADTADLATKSYADTAISTHNSDTTSVHGITDTAELATKAYADTAAANAVTTSLGTHELDTVSVHGIADTSLLVTTTGTQTLTNKTLTLPKLNENVAVTSTATELNVLDGITSSTAELNILDGVTSSAAELNVLTGATLSTTELNYVDGVTSAIQTQLNDKAPIASPTFTGTVSGVTKSHVGLGNVDDTTDANKPISTATQTALDLKANLSGATFTGAVSGTSLTLSGDLTVNGTTTTLNSTTMSVDDKNIELGSVASPSDVTADGGGITLKGATDKTFNWVDATDSWTSSEHINLASGKDLKVNGTAVISSTAGGFIFTDGTQTLEGVPSRTPIVQKTASYTLSSLTERDDLIEMASASAMTLTIPLNSAVAFPIGTSIDILQTSTGQVTIAGDAGVTVNSTPGLKLRTQWSSATLFKRAENTWVVFGDLTA